MLRWGEGSMHSIDLRDLNKHHTNAFERGLHGKGLSLHAVARLANTANGFGEPIQQQAKRIEGDLPASALQVPKEISLCPGIAVHGRVVKSFVFSTDVVTIRNCNADAVLAVYPFPCQPAITQALLTVAECPVFTGVAGSTTQGQRSVDLAQISELQGVEGVVLNTLADAETVKAVAAHTDAVVVVTVTDLDEREFNRIVAGAQIVNVAAGRYTPQVVGLIRSNFPEMPIMASGGKSAETILATIRAGADAITWTPPSMADLEHVLMDSQRALVSSSADTAVS